MTMNNSKLKALKISLEERLNKNLMFLVNEAVEKVSSPVYKKIEESVEQLNNTFEDFDYIKKVFSNKETLEYVIYKSIIDKSELLMCKEIYSKIKFLLKSHGINNSDIISENILWDENFFEIVIQYILRISDGETSKQLLSKKVYELSDSKSSATDYYYCSEDILKSALLTKNVTYKYNNIKVYFDEKLLVYNFIKDNLVSKHCCNINYLIDKMISCLLSSIKATENGSKIIIEDDLLKTIYHTIMNVIQIETGSCDGYNIKIPQFIYNSILSMILLRTDFLATMDIQ
jgi:hypothetical protein